MAILIVLALIVLSAIIVYILIKEDMATSKWMNEKVRKGEAIIITKM